MESNKKDAGVDKPNAEIDSAISPETWLRHFQSLLNHGEAAPPKCINELESLENTAIFSQLDFRIEKCEIQKALKRLNKKASPGIDKISGHLLFEGMGILMPTFNLFSISCFPMLLSQRN